MEFCKQQQQHHHLNISFWNVDKGTEFFLSRIIQCLKYVCNLCLKDAPLFLTVAKLATEGVSRKERGGGERERERERELLKSRMYK